MNEEEKKAIERFKANANYCITSKETTKIILNLIETQSKQIGLMATKIYEEGVIWDNPEQVKSYFKKKASEEE